MLAKDKEAASQALRYAPSASAGCRGGGLNACLVCSAIDKIVRVMGVIVNPWMEHPISGTYSKSIIGTRPLHDVEFT